MLIVMSASATPEQVRAVCERVRELGFTANEIPGAVRVAIGITGNKGAVDPALFNRLAGVAEAVAGQQAVQAGQPRGEAGRHRDRGRRREDRRRRTRA